MFDRPQSGDKAVLVSIDFGTPDHADSLDELHLLSASAGVEVLAVFTGSRAKPDPSTFIGSGKLIEVGEAVEGLKANLVIFNHNISPIQQRNLERDLKVRVLDRTNLILDIFAQRARSHEGKLQVELAQLQHLSTRLVRGWTHLERQKGGIGLRGPGETQLETDRRLIGTRIKFLQERLKKVRRQRTTQQQGRRSGGLLNISLVGYTNAGKSTLFNRLTKSKTFVADQLFATLDTTTRKLYLDSQHSAVISDTVGFIRHLPHTLVAAFRATLEETASADLLLHVVDACNTSRDQQIEEVNSVLAQVGGADIPQILVYNKIDTHPEWQPGMEYDEYGRIIAVRVSALTGAGMDLIPKALLSWAEYETGRNVQAEASVKSAVQMAE
ncbi:MAG: GTPase HflX [Pseudomonadota bacterium]|jgi:GTPase